MRSYAVSVLLTPKKDGSWRMCIDIKEIDKNIVGHKFLIAQLDNMLN